MKLAHLIIDMQQIFLTGKIEPSKIDTACEYINYVSGLLRSGGHLVVHVKDIESLEAGNESAYDFIEGITREPDELTVTKVFSNAFWETGLENLLKKEQVDLVVVCGFAAENCVLFTYNGARERGFKTVVLQHGILSRHDDAITATYRDRDLVSYPVIESMMAGK